MMKQVYRNFYCFLIIEFSTFILAILAFITQTIRLYFIVFSLCSVLCILGYFTCQIEDYIKLRAQNSLWRYNQKLQENYYLSLKQHEASLHIIKNDIQSQINIFQKQDQLENDLDHSILLKEYQYLCNIDYCNNTIIDALIYNKVLLAKNYHIETSIDIRIPDTININSMDMISIYSNLLDNAIDACILCPLEQRSIELHCYQHHQNLILYLKNSKHPNIIVDLKNSFSSKKGDHGLGLHIIDQICKKYQGTLTLENSSDFLETTITLVIRDE